MTPKISQQKLSCLSAYESRVEEFARLEQDWQSRSDKLSNQRLIWFGLGLLFGIIATFSGDSAVLGIFLFLLAFGCFTWFGFLISRHRKVEVERDKCDSLKTLNQQSIQRMHRNWKELQVPRAAQEVEQLAESKDLNLFGPASLFQLLAVQKSPQGRATLAQWLVTPATAEVAEARQAAAVALKDDLDWRQDLAVLGEKLAVEEAEIIPSWLEKPVWLNPMDRLQKYLSAAPWVTLASLVPTILFPQLPALFLVMVGHFYLTGKYKKRIAESLHDLAERERKVRAYSEIFHYMETSPHSDGRVAELMPEIKRANRAMEELNAIATSASSRGSVVHPFLTGFVLFDLRVVTRLETWQHKYSADFSHWFEALGEIEALTSVANLWYEEPDWQAMDFAESGSLRAEQLGHPLLASDSRVCNDVEVGPGGRFLLVTGSNMSGKSTLLRSLGLNIILARAGAPVCAQSLTAPPLTIATSMGVQDSLADGLSFFMAELQRIKQIVQLVISEREQGRTVLFLLDEILQGTNTTERREIVQRVITCLTEHDAMGAVTTHDLALAESEILLEKAELIHFREHFDRDKDGKPTMTFDYRIREGVATTTNALKILEVIEMPV